jgi:hypothetical protein
MQQQATTAQQHELHTIKSCHGYWKKQSYHPKSHKKWENIRYKELIWCL